MKKIAILLLIGISSLCCNKPAQNIDYANVLDSCFSKSEIDILNEACANFESQLSETYPNEALGMKYKNFLRDIGSLNEPVALINNAPKAMLSELKNSSVFDKIWIPYSEVYYEDDSYEVQVMTNNERSENDSDYNPKDFYITNPKGAYLECLIQNQKNKYVNEYLMAVRDIGDVSPHILALGLSNSMKDSDYDDKTVRLIIALNLFYELELIITD